MGSKKKKLNKEAATSELLNKPINRINRNQSKWSNRGNRSHFLNYNEYSRQGFKDVYIRNQSSYLRYKVNHLPNGRPSRKKLYRKPPSRPVSPVLGSEEYMVRKIQQTSAIIMKQLLNPDQQIVDNENQTDIENKEEFSKSNNEENTKICEKHVETVSNKNKSKKITSYNIEEIQKKIMGHITNLNDGRKKNLINSHISGYDVAIQQIQKQKRLEISRALRDMCSKSNQTQKSSDFINSIIPDMGIKIEDIPHELIEELQNTLNLDWDCGNFDDTGYYPTDTYQTVNENVLNVNNSFMNNPGSSQIFVKPEPIDESQLFIEDKAKCNWTGENESNNISTSENVQILPINIKQERTSESPSDKTKEPEENINLINAKAHLSHNLLLHTDQENDVYEHEPIRTSLNCTETRSTHIDDNLGNLCFSIKQENQVFANDSMSTRLEDTEPNQSHADDKLVDLNFDNMSVKSMSLDSADLSQSPINDTLDNINFINKEENQGSMNENERKTSLSNTVTNETHIENELVDLNVNNQENQVCGSPIGLMRMSPLRMSPMRMNLDNTESHEICRNESMEVSLKAIETNEIDMDGTFNHANVVSDNCWNSKTRYTNVETQTEEENESPEKSIETFLTKYFNEPPQSISHAISRMLKIDECVLKLTTYRQSLFNNFMNDLGNNGGNKKLKEKKKREPIEMEANVSPLKCKGDTQINIEEKKENFDVNLSNLSREIKDNVQNSEQIESPEFENPSDVVKQRNLLEFQEVNEKMLVLKVIEDKLLGATESGKIFYFSLEDGCYTIVLPITHLPITSLLFIKKRKRCTQMYIGSLENSLNIYNFENYCFLNSIAIDDSIQCMESSWDYIFIGCTRGYLLRYSLKSNKIEYEDKFSDNTIFVVKPTQEGARKVLLIGSRNSPICIRDAMTGLHMRVMENEYIVSPTVYSLIMDNYSVYCGTTNHDILVFSFHDGKLMHRHKATDSKGISCMKLLKNLLFASCHNGNIYVYDIKTNTFIGSIEGPGGVILSMEVLENQVVIGTMMYKFISVLIPDNILRHKIK